MVRDRDADESSSASQSKRPSLHHQESDSTNSDQAGREHHHQQRTKPQKHLVGAGRLHARVPSSKALHKHHGSTASKLNHRRIASPSPERKPTSITGHRRVQSEAKLSRDNSSTNLSKNASSASLRRNKSHGEVNKKSKSADKLKRTNSNPAVNKVKPQKSQVHFDLGNDGQEDEWVDASASASPYLSRRGSLASAQSSAKHDDSSANNSRTETPTVQPSPPAAATPDRETLQHKAYLTSRLLQRTPSHGAPPKMTADTVSVSRRGHSRSPDSISRVSTLAESHNVSGMPGTSSGDELISRFVGAGSSGAAREGSFYQLPMRPHSRRSDDASQQRPQSSQSSGRPSQRDTALSEDEDGTALAPRSARRSAPPAEKSRTQQKLNLQRASSVIEPGQAVGGGVGVVGASPLVGIGGPGYDGGASRDPRVTKQLERTGMEYLSVARIPFPPPGVHAMPTPVTTMTFDTSQELLWTGNDYGRVTSFYGRELQRYTSFKAHTTPDGPVRQILVNDKGVIVLGSRDVHMASRKGPPIWHIRHDDMKDLRCMTFTSKGTSEILAAGSQDTMFVIDLAKGEIVKQVPTAHSYKIMKKSRYICAATKTGTVNLIDPINFSVIKSWNAHAALISDMDARNDFIVTCGYSLRQGQNYMLDPFLNVFDIKKMSSMSPIPFPAGAAFVRMHPRMSTTSIVMSQGGQMHVVDLMNPNTSNVRQANTMSYLTMFEIAPSGESVALADGEFNIHLWGSHSKLRFVDYASQTEFATPEDPLPTTEWTADTPLNSIGMPYYREVLASTWPELVADVGAPPTKLDVQFLASLKQTEFGMYGRNTRGLRRNQVEDTRNLDKSGASGMPAPKFLSEKARESANTPISGSNDKADDLANPLMLMEIDPSRAECPPMYRNVEIKYSKFGVDDFDFGFYNKTQYSGLEIHIANSYANSLLQVMHFTPLIRNIALQHAATACVVDTCLLCELGFLFDMLQKADGSICQATNLLKTLSHLPQAGPLGLLEEEPNGSPLTAMLQGLTRFLLDKIVQDYKTIQPNSGLMEQMLATSATNSIRCINCRSEYTRPASGFYNDLLYPQSLKNTGRGQKLPRISFSQILKSSVERETTSKGWCSKCQRYQNIAARKTIHSIPAVFVINTLISNAEQRRLWSTPGFLPEEIGVIVDHGHFFCYEGEDLKLHLQRGIHNITVYSLVGMALNIDPGPGQKPHLVAMANAAHAQPTAPQTSQWHLFNDFLVRPVSTEEALAFQPSWKMPSVVVFQLKEANNKLNMDWKKNIDTSLLYEDTNPHTHTKTYRALEGVSEAPGPEMIVALDTEFVAVRQPEIEMNSDGVRETIRPIVYALARASVVRGQGEDEGLPFIDDYISIREPIVDYLTSYSGITHQDLDPRVSKHNLVPLKVAYKKLWILLNLGCKFLGHGLKQDFRVINIHIPKTQVIDTIDLFYLKSRLRKLSLAFLAWYLLKEDIQLETHDSIEDARTALKLYRKYLEFDDAGVLEPMLQDIYRAGRENNFKPPKRGSDAQRTLTPPLPIDASAAPTTPSNISQVTSNGFGAGSTWTPGKGSPLR
ncbi:PAN2-PAN3 deadenylation complex catalytic subunit PAN2 [Colletotrichum sidae]|uniref:PAN2-PAN3 deadenylation complex catalytic subunit PAN2 n=1 Tax=Colletotrichum sidae TaxID=1347389 RepID=A0A4R8T7M2_9PEZI|nr:PAN2-PAN3 deadenylation complex catalytic subunit PAN2 [Colletotrichum sidae]